MTENMKKFLEAVSKSEELTQKVNTMNKEELLALAKELGIEVADADFEKPAGEMDDDELEAVAGGQTCGCALMGGGVANTSGEEVCACFAGGGGEKSAGAGGGCRCACVAAGYGDAVDPLR